MALPKQHKEMALVCDFMRADMHASLCCVWKHTAQQPPPLNGNYARTIPQVPFLLTHSSSQCLAHEGVWYNKKSFIQISVYLKGCAFATFPLALDGYIAYV